MKSIYKIMVALCLTILMSVSINAQNTPEEAEAAYTSGDYAKCVEIYKNIQTRYGDSAELLANMGNAYVKTGDYGNAMLCYRRSQMISPGNKEVKENINYIQNQVADSNKADAKGKNISVAPESKPFFSNLKDSIAYGHTSNFWATMGAVFFVLLCGCIAAYIFMSGILMRKIGFFGGLICACICIVMLIFSFVGASASSRQDRGVVTGYKVTLLDQPFSTSKPISMPLNRGTEMDILTSDSDEDNSSTWYKVRLNSDYIGWIRGDEFEPI